MAKLLVSIILLTFLVFCEVKSQAYNAVVVEYGPELDDTPEDTVLRNAERYTRLIDSARTQGAAIIIFPEYGLTGFTNDVQYNPEAYSTAIPNIGVAPCDYDSINTNYSKMLIDLSCSGRASEIYVVINVIERAQNSSNATVYYNTNVVFDRKGAILAKYRKINLNNERGLTPGDTIVTFSTDFDTTFGIFTSDDILYKKPAFDLLNFANVSNIIYPTRWTVENPFLTPLSVQAGYAATNGLNLLAAGLSDVQNATTGSGIHYFNGTSVSQISSVTTDRSLYGLVPSLTSKSFSVCSEIAPRGLIGGGIPDISQKSFLTEDLSNYTFSDVNLSNNITEETVCSGSYCCKFTVSVQQQAETTEYYKFAVFYGVRNYGYKKTIGVRICALLACESSSSSSCSFASKASTTFSNVAITGNFDDNDNVYDQVVTLLSDYKTLDPSLYSYCVQKVSSNKTVSIDVKTLGTIQGIRAFGIFGRVYSNDNLEAGPKSTAAIMTSFNIISLLLLSYVVFLRK